MKSAEIILLDTQAYYQLRDDLIGAVREEVRSLGEKLLKTNSAADDWITPVEARRLLRVGKTRYQELKNEGAFKCSQDGRKVRVSQKSVLAYLNRNVL